MDALRAGLGEPTLSYVGFSYGTFLGATYAALFPDHYRALVLDGALDAQSWIHDPEGNSSQQTAGFEDALSRFLAACAADQVACSGFGGADPAGAYDELLAKADATPVAALRYTADPRPVDGDDIRSATSSLLYSKKAWGTLAVALRQAADGDASVFRAASDLLVYGRNPDGTYSPLLDRFFTISSSEQRWTRDVDVQLQRGAESAARFPHFYGNSGYNEVANALWPYRDADAYGGPWTLDPGAPTPLVVTNTHDPATPRRGAVRLVAELGNARLLTMDGDGHTAFGTGNSACIDTAVTAYLVDTTLPAPDTVCQQTVPFAPPSTATSTTAAGTGLARLVEQSASPIG
jgi:pimeloyl-ACP methyl ester carboxylesterase